MEGAAFVSFTRAVGPEGGANELRLPQVLFSALGLIWTGGGYHFGRVPAAIPETLRMLSHPPTHTHMHTLPPLSCPSSRTQQKVGEHARGRHDGFGSVLFWRLRVDPNPRLRSSIRV